MRFAIFPVHVSKVLRLPRKKWSQVIRSAAPVTQNHLSKPKDLILQNATLLRKSPPWPPNISDEHVSFIAPATRTASLRILFKCHTAAIVFEGATSPSCSAHFWQGAQSLAPARHSDIWTSKSAPCPSIFLVLLTSKCASRHNGGHIFNISTSKSAPRMVCVAHFDFEMCFARQRRALFRHLNFQNRSDTEVLCTFFTSKCALRHNGVCFSTSQLPKVVWDRQSFTLLTSKCASRHNGVQFFISHLARRLRTRRFSEPTFRPSGAINHWKNTADRDFYLFPRIFCLLTVSSLIFSLLLFSSRLFSSLLFSDSSHLCFSICPYCRKFDF